MTAKYPASYPSTTSRTAPTGTESTGMSIERLQSYCGFTRMPFGRIWRRHAAPPSRPRRSGRPHQLVRGPTRHRGDHRRGRRRQDRRRPRRHRRPGPVPPRGHLPGQPHRRSARHAAPHRRRARADPGFTPPRWPHKPPTRWPPKHAERGRNPSWSSTKPTCSTTIRLEAIRLLTNHDMDSGSPSR